MKHWLQEIWWRDLPPPLPLQWLSRAYGAVADRRGASQMSGAHELPVPVIVVGNIAVGGTGKTPITLWLIEQLRSMGHKPGVISRGYGGRGPFPQLVTAESETAVVGDEPLLIARRSGVAMAVAPRRVAAAEALLAAQAQLDVLICDDGLQHRALARSMELCVVDGQRGHGNGWRIPAGPLRDPLARMGDCRWVLVNGASAQSHGPNALRFDLVPGEAVNLLSGERRALASFATAPLHAVAGIGNPARFFASLSAAGLQAQPHAFADHHAYSPADLHYGDNAPVLMTEKDAVKCVRFNDPRFWAVPVTAQFAEADALKIRHSLLPLFPAP